MPTEESSPAMFRFIHSSDLHIGKRFGNLPEDVRGRLREARHAAIGRLAQAARAHGAAAVLLAGDTFDTGTPTPAMLRQSLAAMGDDPSVLWVILPGNHDSLAADELWSAARSHKPDNVVLAVEPRPIPLGDGVALLPAPCTTRRPGRDLTEWMDRAETGADTIRIGLAHGAIREFSEEGGASDVITPDRAARAGLDYLALGDWHGLVRIGERAFYSGAPEPDRFKHREPGRALAVSIAGPGAAPQVQPVETAALRWRTLDLDLLSGEDAVAALAGILPSAGHRDTLLRIVARGRARLAEQAALAQAVEAAAPDFAHVEFDDGGLAVECEAGDLDAIDRAGALRQAAEALLAESVDEALPTEAREAAAGALARLFSFAQDARP